MITRFTRKVKQLFTRGQQYRPLSLFEALDLSLAHGYNAVNWGKGW